MNVLPTEGTDRVSSRSAAGACGALPRPTWTVPIRLRDPLTDQILNGEATTKAPESVEGVPVLRDAAGHVVGWTWYELGEPVPCLLMRVWRLAYEQGLLDGRAATQRATEGGRS